MTQPNLEQVGDQTGAACTGSNIKGRLAQFGFGRQRKGRLFIENSAAAYLDAHQIGINHIDPQLLRLQVTNQTGCGLRGRGQSCKTQVVVGSHTEIVAVCNGAKLVVK